ncbi:MAG: 30S ribosomal protein S17 [Patescibacteria group bacterium]
MEEKSKPVKKRRLKGEVVSAKMEQTAVVLVKRVKHHKLYKKRIKFSQRFKAHNLGNRYREGDFVEIQETRPLSKEKRWEIIGKTKK